VLLCGVLGVCIGLYFKRKVDRKKLYFEDLLSFCDYFRNDLTYKQNKLKKIILDFTYKSEDLKTDLSNFCEEFSTNINLSNFLSLKEKEEIKSLLSSLGKVDIQTQLTLLEERKNQLGAIFERYKEKSNKDGKLFVKLGLLSGICVGVLLL
jgi:hypothetical protein